MILAIALGISCLKSYLIFFFFSVIQWDSSMGRSVLYDLVSFCLFLAKENRELFWCWKENAHGYCSYIHLPFPHLCGWSLHHYLIYIWILSCDSIWPQSRESTLTRQRLLDMASTALKCVHVVGLQLLQHGHDKNVFWLVHWANVDEKQDMVTEI